MIERICNCEMIPQHLTCFWRFFDAVLVRYAAIKPKLTMLPFCCMLQFVSTYLCEQGWILGRWTRNSRFGSSLQRFRAYPL